MAQKTRASLPPDLDLTGDYQIVWTAVDPTTGALVPNVKVSGTSILLDELAAGASQIGPFLLVPGPGTS